MIESISLNWDNLLAEKGRREITGPSGRVHCGRVERHHVLRNWRGRKAKGNVNTEGKCQSRGERRYKSIHIGELSSFRKIWQLWRVKKESGWRVKKNGEGHEKNIARHEIEHQKDGKAGGPAVTRENGAQLKSHSSPPASFIK